jgi:hypothetical protein
MKDSVVGMVRVTSPLGLLWNEGHCRTTGTSGNSGEKERFLIAGADNCASCLRDEPKRAPFYQASSRT